MISCIFFAILTKIEYEKDNELMHSILKGCGYMAYELLEKELRDLPESNIVDVIEYIQFLKFKLLREEYNTGCTIAERKHPERKLGILRGRFIMSDDFDETPDCFKEYM